MKRNLSFHDKKYFFSMKRIFNPTNTISNEERNFSPK